MHIIVYFFKKKCMSRLKCTLFIQGKISRGKRHKQISVTVSHSMHQIWHNFKVWPLGVDYAIALTH